MKPIRSSTEGKAKKKLPSFTIHISGAFIHRQTVPMSPTEAMLSAAVHALDGVDLSKYNRKDRERVKAAVRYQAMLAAAPRL